MTLEELRTYFVTARNFVKIGNYANTPVVIASIEAMSNHIKEIYKNASVFDKAKCKLQYESFDSIIDVIKLIGISDKRVLAFFGLAPSSASAPSFSDIMSGNINSESTPKQMVTEPKVSSVEKPKKCADDGNTNSEDQKPAPNAQKPKSEGTEPDFPVQVSGSAVTGGGEDKPIYTPDGLRSFIGQQHIVRPLLKEIAIAKNEGRHHLDNILLFGNPGLGKTTLMELIAKELGVRFEKLDCSQFRNSQQSLKALQSFLLRIARENEPVVIALDEIHALTLELQDSLLTLLNDRVYVSPPDISGNIKRIAIEEFTFIGATTDDVGVREALKNRCLRLTFQMVDYTTEELRRIYKNKISSKGLTIDDDALDTCIPRSRGAIRYVNSIVEGLDKALYNDEGIRVSMHIDLKTALDYFKEKGIDPMGLTPKDLEILHVLNEHTGDAMGAEVLAARVGLETKKYVSEYEKYLIKIGFIDVSGKGRALTESAVKYLAGDGDSDAKTSNSGVGDTGGNSEDETGNVDDSNVDNAPKDIIDDLFGD